MKKEKFIKELSKRIQHLNQDERMDIINYYSELIDDKIESGESEEYVIDDLGTIDFIVYNLNENRRTSVKENDSIKPSNVETKKVFTENKEKKPKARKVSWIKVLLLILALPILVAIGASALGVAFGLIGALFGVCIAFFSLPLVGLYYLVGSIVAMGVNFDNGLLQLGLSLLLIGAGGLLLSLFKGFISIIWKCFIFIFKAIGKLFSKGGALIYE